MESLGNNDARKTTSTDVDLNDESIKKCFKKKARTLLKHAFGYACGTCGRRFSEKFNMQVHERIHTGSKPYKCHHCPKSFSNLGNLNDHERRHLKER